MKRILFILITIPLIFCSCEKEENPSDNNNNSNNNSTLVLENTIWDMTSFSHTDNNSGNVTNINIPYVGEWGGGHGINNIRWTFSESINDGWFVQKRVTSELDIDYDSLSYTYFPSTSILLIDDDNTEPGNLEIPMTGNINLTIIEYSLNNMVCEWIDNSDGNDPNNETWRFFLTKVQ